MGQHKPISHIDKVERPPAVRPARHGGCQRSISRIRLAIDEAL